jgi:GTP:adenosylcobinamide-phosphate guanylyltransferase
MYVIVQAGGRGSRLRHHTWNKPKCLVSVRGKPLLYHLFDSFPDSEFVIIGDYHYEQFAAYLESNPPPVKWTLIEANGKGTCSGIAQASEMLLPETPVLLIWSDIIVGDVFRHPAMWVDETSPQVFVTDSFACRWSYINGELVEQTSHTSGVPGIFWFKNKQFLSKVPAIGEFVRWFSKHVKDFSATHISNIEELGDFARIESSNDTVGFCRFFNEIIIDDSSVTKKAKDPNYQQLILNEFNWYSETRNILGFTRTPEVIKYPPLTMTRIPGDHVWQFDNLSRREQRAIVADILHTLQDLHSRGYEQAIPEDCKKVYIEKTQQRVHSVCSLIPGFEKDSVTVNGIKCKNPFHKTHQNLWAQIEQVTLAEQFAPIHGDPTFSNTLIDQNLKTWFIDPRGYFANAESVYGDPDYDYAKVYYSAVGGYDAFNRRKFKLHIDDETAEIIMEPPVTAESAEQVFNEFFPDRIKKIKILHGLIWLSLSGYARDDVDSVIGSFYLGLYYLKQGLDDVSVRTQ